jgi:hypothetical protein
MLVKNWNNLSKNIILKVNKIVYIRKTNYTMSPYGNFILCIYSKFIENLKSSNLKRLTGSCLEICLEKLFKNLKIKRLNVCKLLKETCPALEINHTVANSSHKKFDEVIKNIFKNK